MYDRILFPTDGSDVAAAAGEAALTLAQQFDAGLHAVYVLEGRSLPAEIESSTADERRRLGREILGEIDEQATDAGIDVTTAVLEEEGHVHSTLVDYTDGHDVDCLVMGTHGRTGIGRLVLGSVAEQTLRESPVPVVTIHEETVFDPAFDSILVPTDGSDSAQAALDHAIELALTTGAALHVVNVVDIGVVMGDVDAGLVLDTLEEAGEQAIEVAIHRAREAGVSTVEASVLSGTPYRAICDYTDERDVDCIVMGTHGRTGVGRVVLGSVTERVVRYSDVPVIATKASPVPESEG